MREILFRGFNKENGCWFYGLLGKFDGKHYIITNGGVKPFVDWESVGQFTGFYDKDHNKIFEGDIVEYEIESAGDIYINEVAIYFDEELGMWMAHDSEVSEDIQLHSISNKCQVIGNFYERQKLQQL